MELDAIDKRLLLYLYHHYRESFATIAKACKISKKQVAYRIEKFEKSGLVRSYLTLYDYNKLGFSEFIIIYLRCKDKDAVREELLGSEHVVTCCDVLGTYNLALYMVYEDKNTFAYSFNAFLAKHKNNIISYDTLLATHMEFYDLKMLGAKKIYRTYTLTHLQEPVKLSSTERKLLKLIENNGRMRITEIARRLDMSAPAALKMLRKLKNSGVIQGVRLFLNMEIFGYYWAELHVQLRAADAKTIERVLGFCREHARVNAVSVGVGACNCNIQLMYKHDEELRSGVRDILKAFKEDIDDYKILLIENEVAVHTYPFSLTKHK